MTQHIHNPIFDFLDESAPVYILEHMGFEYFFVMGLDDMTDEEEDKYYDDPLAWIDSWIPKPPEGYTAASKYETEDGPVALSVRPKTRFAQELLAFGLSDEAQEAYRKDHEESIDALRAKAEAAVAS